jgi:hypothetical protein
MKTIKVLAFAMLLSISSAYAQQVHMKNKKVYLNNLPYGYLHKSGSVWGKDYLFQNTKNEDIATIKAMHVEMANGYDYTYYEVTFLATGQKAEMDNEAEFERKLSFDLAGYKVLKNDMLNPEGVQKFMERYPTTISKRLISGNNYQRKATAEK